MPSEDDLHRLLASVRAWFDAPEQAGHYREEAPTGLTPAEAWLLTALPPTGRLLDLGCGAGRVAAELARRGYSVVGADVSTELLRWAGAHCREGCLAAAFLRVDPLRLPFRDQSFDAALAIKVYGYLPGRANRQRYLHQVGRLLRPGAPLLLVQYIVIGAIYHSYHDQEDHRRAAASFSSLEPGDAFTLGGAGYLHIFTPDRLRREYAASGLAVEVFESDQPHGGNGWLRLAVLRKR